MRTLIQNCLTMDDSSKITVLNPSVRIKVPYLKASKYCTMYDVLLVYDKLQKDI